MKAVVVTEPGKLEVVNDCPMPEIGEYDALVKIHTSGFCNGTDTRIIFGEMAPQQGMQPYPCILGHEAAGVIQQVGARVKYLHTGEKHMHIMGVNPKGAPYYSMHGQMAEYGLLRDWQAMEDDGIELPPDMLKTPSRLPDDFDLVDAGVLLPLCECLSAVKNFDIGPHTDVLIYGAGPMGLAMMRYMRILGAKSIVCVDSVPERLEAAVNIAEVDIAINYLLTPVEDILGGRQFDRIVDAVGLSSILLENSKRLRPFGSLCCLGVLRKTDSSIDLSLLKNNTKLHMLNFPYQEYHCLEENLQYIKDGRINPKDYYSHVMPMDDVQRALDLVMQKKTTKVILTV